MRPRVNARGALNFSLRILPLVLLLSPAAQAAGLPALNVAPAPGGGQSYSLSLQVLILMTALTLLPAALLTMTAFTRIVVVLGLLRQALGTGATPSNQILVGLSMFLSLFVMQPVFERVYEDAVKPYLDGKLEFEPALAAAAKPMRGFMMAMRASLSFSAERLEDPTRLPALLGNGLLRGLLVVAPILIATLLAAVLAPLLIGGWNFSPQALQPDLKKLNPLTGIGRMFSMNSVVELSKSIAKFGLIGLVAGLSCWSARNELPGLGAEGAARGIAHGSALLVHAFVWMAAALAAIAAIDVPYQLWTYGKQMKMSKQEIREEHKQSEGRPEVKGRIRRMQQELSQRRMMEHVPKADVIVTNPTHYAVALQYSAGAMRAPRVVAKGADLVALAIRELGAKHGVAIVEAPPLARALYRGCELEQEIPAPLYAAVAQVLAYVYQLRAYVGGAPPQRPDIRDVPGGEADAAADA